MIKYPTTAEALELHRRLLATFGGATGVRDIGLLESALHRPQTGYYGDLPEMAAALLESLLLNHAFVDGNKRVAFFLTDVFLRINGFKMKVEPKRAHAFLIGYIESQPRELATLTRWIRIHLGKL